ncbi:hypothetical protein V6N12_030153 [Hibiscus sabdariffa]
MPAIWMAKGRADRHRPVLEHRHAKYVAQTSTTMLEQTDSGMAKRLIPTLNRVLVEKIIPPSKTTSGILLPEKSTKLNSGKVVAVGPGAMDKGEGKAIAVPFKEGDTVLLPEFGGSRVKLGDKEFYLYRDEDILGTFHD